MTDEQGRYTPNEIPVGAQLINLRTQLTRLDDRVSAIERLRADDRGLINGLDVVLSDLRYRAAATTERVTELDNRVRVMAELIGPPAQPCECDELWRLARALEKVWSDNFFGGVRVRAARVRAAREALIDYVREHS